MQSIALRCGSNGLAARRPSLHWVGVMLVCDQPLPIFLPQPHRQPGRGGEDLQQRMARGDGATREDVEICHFERACTSTVIGEEQFPRLSILVESSGLQRQWHIEHYAVAGVV